MELPIEQILDTYRLETPDKAVREAARKSIEQVTGLTFPISAISYRQGTLRVKAGPLERSRIHIKKEAILEDLQNRLEKNITDIR